MLGGERAKGCGALGETRTRKSTRRAYLDLDLPTSQSPDLKSMRALPRPSPVQADLKSSLALYPASARPPACHGLRVHLRLLANASHLAQARDSTGRSRCAKGAVQNEGIRVP